MLSLSINLLLGINVVVSLLIIFIVLMQRPKSEGLGAAFGGGMTENLFGAQTSNVLANFTRWLGGIFFFVTLVLSILYAKQSHQLTQLSPIQKAAIEAAKANPAPSALPGAGAVSGTAALSGSSDIKVGVSVASPATTPAPVPSVAAPASSGSAAR